MTTPNRKAVSDTGNADAVVSLFIDAVPDMDEARQRLAITLYRTLAMSKPVSVKQLADMLEQTEEDIRQALSDWHGVFFDDDNDVIGFWGIAVKPMSHRMEIDGATSYAWCAWDSLFIPELVGKTAHVTSHCGQSGEEITLTVSPGGATAESHDDVVVSFVTPAIEEIQTNTTANFCHLVYFFKDRPAGEAWLKDHPEAFLLTLDEAFAVGKKLNARYNLVHN